jgi:hypothetical protein
MADGLRYLSLPEGEETITVTRALKGAEGVVKRKEDQL